jgi:farnesyl diphosphate synthase
VQVYLDYEQESYSKIMGMIDATHGSLPKAIFIDFAQKIYKRKK